jgi:hypothetical protein
MEKKVQELLSVVDGTEKISGLISKKLLDRMLAAYKNKVGAVREHGLKSAALFYFAARGVVDWEDEHREDVTRKKPSRPSCEG